jgi:diguanylate cyclase (GGDEF)-like protein
MISSGSDILWVSAAALAVTSASLTGFGLRQQRYRGWRWWLAALWLTALGVAAAAVSNNLAVPAALLLAQWPIVTLIGVRRFHARTRLPGSEKLDWAVLAIGGSLAASGPLWPADGTMAALVPASAAALVHLYAGCLLFGGPGGRDSLPLQWLGVAIALVALAPLPTAWPGYEVAASIELRAVAAVLGAVVMAFVALTLVFERTERQLRDSQRRLRVLANTDSLTNVPNRRHFTEMATLALRADAPGSATLLIFDIDHFKRINDKLGHAAGDRALRLVSGSMTEHLRAQDVAGRHGGDEFVLLLRGTHVRDAGGVAARIVARLQEQAEFSTLPRLSLSFGMVQVLPGEGVADAMRRADQALYEAKRQGRSRAVTALGDEEQPVFTESRPLGLTAV